MDALSTAIGFNQGSISTSSITESVKGVVFVLWRDSRSKALGWRPNMSAAQCILKKI